MMDIKDVLLRTYHDLKALEKELVQYKNNVQGNIIKSQDDIQNGEEIIKTLKGNIKDDVQLRKSIETQLANVRSRLSVVDDNLSSVGIELNPEKKKPAFTSLPPELRIMIYRFALVEPHKGYLRCYYDLNVNWISKLYVSRNIPLQLFQVSRQINDEASGLFYSESIFAIAEQNRSVRNIRNYHLLERKSIDVSRIQKLHITNRDCKWLSNPSRTSPGVYRDASKHHISAFAKAINPTCHNLQYLLIDCLSGFGASNRIVANILRPLEALATTRIKEVHIVSNDYDHFPYIRYLEHTMTDPEASSFNLSQDWIEYLEDYYYDMEDHRDAKAGNDLAALLKIKPCYPSEETTGG